MKRILTTTGQDLLGLFDAEARRQLDLQGSQASLPAIQGLLIMFISSSYLGRDRAGLVYRHLGYDMFRKFEIQEKITQAGNPQEKAACSKTAWGIYCYER